MPMGATGTEYWTLDSGLWHISGIGQPEVGPVLRDEDILQNISTSGLCCRATDRLRVQARLA